RVLAHGRRGRAVRPPLRRAVLRPLGRFAAGRERARAEPGHDTEALAAGARAGGGPAVRPRGPCGLPRFRSPRESARRAASSQQISWSTGAAPMVARLVDPRPEVNGVWWPPSSSKRVGRVVTVRWVRFLARLRKQKRREQA